MTKKIKRQEKLCDDTFEHTVKITEWKKEIKLKENLIDDEYEIDEKATYEASSYDSLIVGSENYGQQYPYIAYQNLINIFNTTQRRLATTKFWKVPQPLCTSLGLNIFTPIHFKDQLNLSSSSTNSNNKKSKKNKKNTKKLPFICQESKPIESLSKLKDGTNSCDMPYFTTNDGVEVSK